MKVLDTLWFTQMSVLPTIGIVLVEFEAGDDEGEPGQHGAYIGGGYGKAGQLDSKHIMERGAKVHPVHVGALWVHFKGEIK